MPENENARIYRLDTLQEYGESAARRIASVGSFSGRRISRRMRLALRPLRREAGGAAGEWLSDNRYLIEREALAAASDFAGVRRVPAGDEDARICEGAYLLAERLSGAVTLEGAAAFFEGFQRVHPLSLSELRLLGAALRAGLVSLISREFTKPESSAELVSAAINSLRRLSTEDISELIRSTDLAGRILSRESCGVYPLLDERTRLIYRSRLAANARRMGVSEVELAEALLEKAEENKGDTKRGHVGWWLLEEPFGRRCGAHKIGLICAVNIIITLIICTISGIFGGLGGALLALLPAYSVVRGLSDAVLLRIIPRNLPPRLELKSGVPPEGRTIAVISAILKSPGDGKILARRLEEFYHASRDCGRELSFGILADLPESERETDEGDEEAASAAKNAVDVLNSRYSGGFYLFLRPRREVKREKLWRGYERKRGALATLARLCSDYESDIKLLSGDRKRLKKTRFILTLDADTRLLPGAARELIGAMLHPLNRPVVKNGRVVSGHGVIHPRIGTELSSSSRSLFARIMAGPGGVEPYGSAAGEVWMDLTGHGGFAGKGILDIAALLECCSDLPENRILSHDAIEGALLRGGYMGDTLLTDGFPARASAYLRRQHRWTRGDWQNVLLPRSLRRRLSGTDTLRLADCVRRSLTAPANLLAIVLPLLLPGSGLAFAGACALLSLASGLGVALMAALTRRSGREKHPASRLYGAALALARSLLALLLLPAEAWTELSAGATALWRVLVTKRRLLEWQTAASQERGSLAAALGALWPECAAGAALLFLAPEPAGKTLGLIWLFAPLIALTLTRPAHREPLLAERDRRFLLSECRKMWLYFAELCTPERGYLPPDNYQVFPPTGAAERTSPTNIALAMAACLAAADMGLENPKRALELLEGMLASCEGLEKWRGHLYNWYDTRTLRPMEPRYVSAVDSGNLAAGLTAVAAGLAEYGRADLAGRAAALRDGMDFAALFDEKRRLFRIGIDVSAGKAGEGCYDLLASEARLTGYYAVAHGDVPLRHWRQLSRALVGKDGYRGLASWTGTMFEYLMPELFLPLERGSLLWESARFCLYVQRRDTPPHLPWGQSESAYFSLDAAMSYRYKAHGCARLALKRGMEADTVCAPYAAYLALAAAPGAAVRDLRRFASLDAGGRYGLWEAIDFTPRRTTSRRGESVQCVMAHHLGMSLAASANALTGGVMQRRFMSDPAMAAYSSLLGESAPEGAVLLRRRLYRPLAQSRPRPAAVAAAEGRCSGAAERVFPLSNGVYSLLAAENGLSAGCAGGIAVYRGFDGAPGLRVSLDTGGGRTDLLPLPGREGGLGFRYVLRGGLLRFDGEGEQLASSVSLAVSARDTAELRITELTSVRPLEGELVFELEPALARAEDYAAHPAYWRLGLEAEERGGALLIRRRPRPGLHGCWLCIAADAPAAFRANIDGEALGALSYPYVSCRVPLSLKAGGTARIRLAITFAATAEEALDAAGRTLASSPAKLADLVSALGAVSALPQNMLAQLFELAGRLCFARCEGGSPRPRGELWAAGVPGDYPICAVRAEPDGGHAALIASRHRLLALAGIRSELVFIAGDAADYQRPAETAVRRALASAGLEGLTGARGGVFIVSGEHAAAVEGSAAVLLEPDGMPKERRRPSGAQARISRPRRGGAVEHESAGGEFRFYVRGALPRRAWTLPMSNGRFGYLAADCGLGGMWAANAREERINAWICDDRAVSGPETLETLWGGRRLSLFAAEDGHECRVRYGLGYAVWEKLGASVTAFVPSGAAARVLIIENAPGDVLWHSSLQLAAEARDAAFVVTELAGGLLRAVNPRTGLEFAAAFSVMARAFTCDEAAFIAGELRSERGAALAPCFAAMLPRSERLVIACGCCGAEELVRLAEPDNARRELELVRARFARLCRGAALTTGLGAADAWLDGWAVYQTLVCRLLARTSLYQSGGAYGFRDQLQDAANLLDVDARYARERILDACAHQYDGGDVMHWWHPGKPDRGVRTRISDDLLWLPWAVCEYLDATGDTALPGEEVCGIASPPLGADERSRYESAVSSQRAMSVLEHCEAAFGCVLRRGFGSHGLLRMGGGDWCDGFDGVGGESVWLTEFFAHTAERFAPLLDTRSAAALKSAARRCRRGVEAAWDGEWYRRGYYADGRPLGSRESAGCQIDAVAQAWAVFAGCNGDRCDAALTSALERLFDSEGGVVRLFDPPFGDGTEQAGYINGYGEGFRENGGQYTHAAVWLALACLERGRRDDARRLVEAIFSRGESYGAEPFVLAADVYANAARYGEAGWSWYTGAAGWMLRLLKRLRET